MTHASHRSPFLLAVAALALAATVANAAPPGYSLVGSFTPNVSGVFDAAGSGAGAAAGRMYSLAFDGGVWLQDSINASAFTRVGSVDSALFSAFGPAFVRVSPDGSTLAIGNGNFGPGSNVLFLSTASLNPMSASAVTPIASFNTDAHWSDNNTLFVSGADFSTTGVTRIDTASLSSRLVVSNVGGASGGVTTDGAYLYTGNGFDFASGGSETGEVRAFSLAAITNAAASGVPLDFEGVGRPVAEALSAYPLAFDNLGNLLVGGADGVQGDEGYAAAISASAIQLALGGGPIAPDPEERRVSPHGADFYGVAFNSATNEWLVNASGTFYRYAIPTPASVLPLAFIGAPRARRQRRDA